APPYCPCAEAVQPWLQSRTAIFWPPRCVGPWSVSSSSPTARGAVASPIARMVDIRRAARGVIFMSVPPRVPPHVRRNGHRVHGFVDASALRGVRWKGSFEGRRDAHEGVEESTVLKDHTIVPYIPVSDVARARKFYEEKVGLVPAEEYAGGVIYRCGKGSWVFLYPS